MMIIFVGATTPGADWNYPQVILLGTATGALGGVVVVPGHPECKQ